MFERGRYDVEGIPASRSPAPARRRRSSGPSASLLSPTTDITFANNLTWIKSAHTLRLGVIVTRNRKDQNGRNEHTGEVNFNPTGNPNSTGYSFADALLGNFRTYSEGGDDPLGFFRFTQYGALRVGHLARAEEPEPRDRAALRVPAADLHAGQQHHEFRSGALRPDAADGAEPERQRRRRLGQSATPG